MDSLVIYVISDLGFPNVLQLVFSQAYNYGVSIRISNFIYKHFLNHLLLSKLLPRGPGG